MTNNTERSEAVEKLVEAARARVEAAAVAEHEASAWLVWCQAHYNQTSESQLVAATARVADLRQKRNDAWTALAAVEAAPLVARTFPVLNQSSERLAMPRSVPWAFVEAFRRQAEDNHGQTLEQLAGRGGLAPEEMWLAANGLGCRDIKKITERDAITWLILASALPEPAAPDTTRAELLDARRDAAYEAAKVASQMFADERDEARRERDEERAEVERLTMEHHDQGLAETMKIVEGLVPDAMTDVLRAERDSALAKLTRLREAAREGERMLRLDTTAHGTLVMRDEIAAELRAALRETGET